MKHAITYFGSICEANDIKCRCTSVLQSFLLKMSLLSLFLSYLICRFDILLVIILKSITSVIYLSVQVATSSLFIISKVRECSTRIFSFTFPLSSARGVHYSALTIYRPRSRTTFLIFS